MKHFKSIFLFLCMTQFFCANAQDNAPIKEFNFGGNPDKKSGTVINKAVAYTKAIGYGFDLQSDKNVTFDEKSISAKSPFYFSIKLPEGNYRVEVVLGGNNSSVTTVKAESRRLMLREIKTAAKETKTERFVVNVRTARFDINSTITLKPAELKGLNWDEKLTLEFLGTSIVQSIKITEISKIRTIYMAGDSTVMEHDVEPWASWPQFFPNYLKTDMVVANYACSGLTLRSFVSGYRLDKILYMMEPGDYLFIEFGHNDEKATGDGKGASGVYSALLKDFITKVRNKGGSPILITPIQRRYFNPNGTVKPTHGEFPDAMRKVAQEMGVPLIDATKMTTSLYQSWGNELSKKAFVPDDNTHFNSFGANEVARCIVQNIKNAGLDLAKNIKPTVPHYIFKNPSKPSDWTVPMSARLDITKPDGE